MNRQSLEFKISIIIPVYNVRDEIIRAVDSVKNQSFSKWQLVLVDDGSTDGSADVCDSLSISDDRIITIHQDNQGVVVARQRGFYASDGEWVMFLDGDDALKSDCLKGVADDICRYKCDIVQFGFTCINADGSKEDARPVLEGLKSVCDIISCSKNSPLDVIGMCIWNKCFRRNAAQAAFCDVGDVHITHSEDGLYALAALLHVNTVYFDTRSYYKYIIRAQSAVHRVNMCIVEEKKQFLNRIRYLADKTGCITAGHLERMIEFHAYQACCYILMMLKRNRATFRQMTHVLEELARADFYLQPNRNVNTIKRRLLYFFVCHPFLWYILPV